MKIKEEQAVNQKEEDYYKFYEERLNKYSAGNKEGDSINPFGSFEEEYNDEAESERMLDIYKSIESNKISLRDAEVLMERTVRQEATPAVKQPVPAVTLIMVAFMFVVSLSYIGENSLDVYVSGAGHDSVVLEHHFSRLLSYIFLSMDEMFLFYTLISIGLLLFRFEMKYGSLWACILFWVTGIGTGFMFVSLETKVNDLGHYKYLVGATPVLWGVLAACITSMFVSGGKLTKGSRGPGLYEIIIPGGWSLYSLLFDMTYNEKSIIPSIVIGIGIGFFAERCRKEDAKETAMTKVICIGIFVFLCLIAWSSITIVPANT